ncbi:MAG: acyclic terpene utilization AtuA family protein [Balneolaceae bacterium]
MKEIIRIASGQGFWGDLPRAPVDQIRKGAVDYLVLDYLAEVTMSILQKQRMRNRNHGYARDFVEMLDEVLPELVSKGIRVITNAGGVNPVACKDAILEIARKHNITQLTVAVVDGDDILDRIGELTDRGHLLRNMETGSSVEEVKDRLLSANVYFGSRPVVDALRRKADIVVTGRLTDTGLTLGAMAHEFNWSPSDYDRLAAGTVAGHFIECGAQASGGNLTDWEEVPDMAGIGFPVIEAHSGGHFYITKHEGTGGRISEMTVKEQLLYEIGDPSAYITPDVIADFTTVKLRQVGKDRVEVTGIKGRPETSTYKISASYKHGFKIASSLVYCWPDAVKKALSASDILRDRIGALGLAIDDFRAELVGLNACDEDPRRLKEDHGDLGEVQLRISARGPSGDDLDRLGKEIVPLVLTGPGGVTGYAGGRPRANEIVAYWPALLDKKSCKPQVSIYHP